jgi:pyruvate/2-oxoglutarate/acetoin dehydrogenase E1 component
LPVFENTQLGMATGWALDGGTPICLFPRWDFLMCAMDQLVNHLDKLPMYSAGRWKPRVIIRVGVGAQEPLFPGHQHIGDYTQAMRHVLHTIDVFPLHEPHEICERYQAALVSPRSTILVEYASKY